MVNYTTVANVGLQLNRPLTDEEVASVAIIIDGVGAFFDKKCGRTLVSSSPIVDEMYYVGRKTLYLKQSPIIAVTSLSVRLDELNSPWIVLATPSQYEVIDATTGRIIITSYYASYLAKISYTVSSLVPKDIELAATLMAVHFMQTQTHLRSIRVAEELAIIFNDLEIPETVKGLLSPWRRIQVT